MRFKVGDEIRITLFGHPPKPCKSRTGKVIWVQDDFFLVQTPRAVRPIPFDIQGNSIKDARRCVGCLKVTLDIICCGETPTRFIHRVPTRYYISSKYGNNPPDPKGS